MQSTVLATLTAVLAGAFANASAIPSTLQERCTVVQNAQSCSCTDSYDVEDGVGLRFYTVTVGEAYVASTCSTVKTALENSFSAFQGWSCSETDCGWFKFKFEITNYQSDHATIINNELESIFPAVNGFNCPAY